MCVGLKEFGDVEVESRIIHQDNDVRLPVYNVFLAQAHVGKDDRQMDEHRDEAHVGQFAVVLDARPADGCHQVASEKPEFGFRVFVA